jgi:hypothetical protein
VRNAVRAVGIRHSWCRALQNNEATGDTLPPTS